jgi:hypothetical protein
MSKRAILSIAVIAGLLATAGTASAGLIVADGFETSATPTSSQYEAGVNILGQGPDISGFSGDWGNDQYQRFVTVETGISGFFKIEEVGGLDVAQAASSDRHYERTITADTPAASKTYWLAFSANFANTTNAVSMGYGLTSEDTLDFGMSDGEFKIEEDAAGSTPITFGTAEADTDYLLIASVEITHFGSSSSQGGLEKLNAWVFSAADFAGWDKQQSTLDTAATEALGETDVNLMYNGGSPAGLSNARLNFEGVADGTKLDEYRISTDFDGLDIVPEPATMSMLAIGGLGALLRRKRR